MDPDEQQLPDDLPLLALFTRLRQAGLPLGMTEYHLVLEALRSGFGLPDDAALARLCRTLWTKSEEDQLLFDYHFEQVMAENVASFAAEEVSLFPVEESSVESVPAPVNFAAKAWQRVPVWTRWGIGGLLVAISGTTLWSARPKCPYFTSSPEDVVTQSEQYYYPITACKANASDDVEITVLSQHPWLNFDPNPSEVEGENEKTALLSADAEEVGSVFYSQAELWDFQGNRIASLEAYVEPVTSIQFSADGQRLLTTYSNGTARLWNLQGRQLAEVSHLSGASNISLSADGQRILSFNENGAARLFDEEGNIVSDFGKRTNIREIRFSPSTQLMLSRTGEGSVRLWDLDGKQQLALNNLGILQAELTPDEESLLTLSNRGQVQRWDLTGKRLSALNTQFANAIQISPTGEYVLTSSDNDFRVWNLQGQLINSLKSITDHKKNIVFSPDGQKILILDWERSVNNSADLWCFGSNSVDLWRSENNSVDLRCSSNDSVYLWDFHENQVTDLESNSLYTRFSPDGQHILLGDYDSERGYGYSKSLRLWNLESWQQITDFDVDGLSIASIKFSPEGQYLIVENYDFLQTDRTIRIWDLEGDEAFPLTNAQEIVISSDEQLLATISRKSEVKLQVTDLGSNRSDTQTFNLVSSNDTAVFSQRLNEELKRLGVRGAVLIALVPVGYLLTRWLLGRVAKPTEFPPLPELDSKVSPSAASLNQGVVDEVQVAQAIHQGSTRDSELPLNSFTQTNEYFPLTSRQMKQSWRYLRRLTREGPLVELDVDATVRQVSREGMLLQPLLRARRVNRNELLLLVDQDGSMVPFHSLSQRLANTAISGGRLAKAGVYYFHNCPVDYVYCDPYLQEAEPIREVLTQLHAEYAGVLIFSDAGAARGAFNQKRLAFTLDFLAQLRSQLKYIAWINPMPRDRWTGTAAEIARQVPMFELSRQGLNQAIDVLRGKQHSTHEPVSMR